MSWAKLKYSKSEVKKAGKILKDNNSSDDEISNAIEVLNNWRAVHSYPLHIFQMTLKNVSKKADKTSLVAQRLKRANSILRKLNRTYNKRPTMELTQMQDIAGCRAIVKNVKIANDLYENYYLKGNLKHKRVGQKDYISNPKSDGYRGFHIVYEYKSDKEGKKEYNGLRIEVQIRTKLQHQWATAVETVDFITRQAIKFNEGHPDWSEFFKLVSSAFAIKEKCPTIESIEDKAILYAKIKEKEQELGVIERLIGWTSAIKLFNEEVRKKMKGKAKFFLLELDISASKLMIKSFTQKQEEEAVTEYSELEKKHKEESTYDVVLVGADTTKDLEKAYPNYFADTKDFISELKEIISKVQ